jgi:hypothetical protein
LAGSTESLAETTWSPGGKHLHRACPRDCESAMSVSWARSQRHVCKILRPVPALASLSIWSVLRSPKDGDFPLVNIIIVDQSSREAFHWMFRETWTHERRGRERERVAVNHRREDTPGASGSYSVSSRHSFS